MVFHGAQQDSSPGANISVKRVDRPDELSGLHSGRAVVRVPFWGAWTPHLGDSDGAQSALLGNGRTRFAVSLTLCGVFRVMVALQSTVLSGCPQRPQQAYVERKEYIITTFSCALHATKRDHHTQDVKTVIVMNQCTSSYQEGCRPVARYTTQRTSNLSRLRVTTITTYTYMYDRAPSVKHELKSASVVQNFFNIR